MGEEDEDGREGGVEEEEEEEEAREGQTHSQTVRRTWGVRVGGREVGKNKGV